LGSILSRRRHGWVVRLIYVKLLQSFQDINHQQSRERQVPMNETIQFLAWDYDQMKEERTQKMEQA
jgi:hypothetical protein